LLLSDKPRETSGFFDPMKTTVVAVASAVAALNAGVGLLGAWRWYRVEPSRVFWPLLRAAQLADVALAVFIGALAAAGHSAHAGLFYLYALLPLAINLVAEQLRIVSAESVLTNRGLEGARQVGELPDEQQRSIVVEILRRELGVMAASALVVAVLLLRAATTASGF
jgi:hypothetical protein